MALKGKKSLYLAIACFVGIVVIFFFDGYLGVYDTVRITTSELETTIEPDYWLRRFAGEPQAYYLGAEWGKKVFFHYELDNRRFSSYSTVVRASVWKENEKVLELVSEEKIIEPFDKAVVEWTIDSKALPPYVLYAGQYAEYTVKMGYGGVERRIVINYRGSSYSP